MKKFQKLFDPKFGKKVGGWTPPTNSESRMLSKGTNSENFLTSNLEWPKKVGEQTPLPRIQSPECSVKEEIPKTFWPQIWHDLKKLVPRPWPSPKNWNSRVLYKGKNSEIFLTSNLAWPKIVGAQIPPPKISESRVVGKGKKIPKNFCSKIWHNQKKLVSEIFLTSNLAWPKIVGAQIPPPKFQSPE